MAGVGAAAVMEGIVRRATLPSEATVFSAEIHAVQLAINIATDTNFSDYVIFSDCSSIVTTISSLNFTHPIIRKLQHNIFDLKIKQNKTIIICCIPGHAGIVGNERADLNAKLATTQPVQAISIYYKNWYSVIREKITDKWNTEWQTDNQKMREIRESGRLGKNKKCK